MSEIPKIEYKIIRSYDKEHFEQTVTAHLLQGYTPCAGVSYADGYYHQALLYNVGALAKNIYKEIENINE